MEEFKKPTPIILALRLPKGKLRFYRRDTDGHLEFIGENTIDHTPKDETIRIFTGNAFDVVASANAPTITWTRPATGWTSRSKSDPQSQEGSGEGAGGGASLSLDELEAERAVADFTARTDAQTVEFSSHGRPQMANR